MWARIMREESYPTHSVVAGHRDGLGQDLQTDVAADVGELQLVVRHLGRHFVRQAVPQCFNTQQ